MSIIPESQISLRLGVRSCPFNPHNCHKHAPWDHYPGVTLAHWRPVSQWTVGQECTHEYLTRKTLYEHNPELFKSVKHKLYHQSEPSNLIIDRSTGDAYLNERPLILRVKFLGLLILSAVLITPLASAINVIFRSILIVSGYHFWGQINTEKPYDLKGRFIGLGIDAGRILFSVVSTALRVVTSLYGLFISPLNARKLYATIERTEFGAPVFAWCMRARNNQNQQNSEYSTDISQRLLKTDHDSSELTSEYSSDEEYDSDSSIPAELRVDPDYQGSPQNGRCSESEH